MKKANGLLRLIICATLAVPLAGTAQGQVSFEILDTPTQGHWADFSLSRDGKNMGCLLDGAVYWWTATDGFRFLDAGSPTQGGVGMSAAGNALIATQATEAGTAPAIWYRDGSSTVIAVPAANCPDDHISDLGYDLNADGTMAVGQIDSCDVDRAFVWSRNTGVHGLTADSNRSTRGTAVSADGQVIVGFCDHPVDGYRRPAVWQHGARSKLFLGQDQAGEALNISLNGRMVVGQADMGGPSPQAFCWMVDREPIALGNLSGRATDSSLASAVSDDGKVVGWSGDELWGSQEAFIWNTQAGMRSMTEILADGGIVLPDGLRLTGALDISGDGTTVVGVCRDKYWNQLYWRVRLDKSYDLTPVVNAETWKSVPAEPVVPDSIDVHRADMLFPFPFGKRRY